MTYRYSFSVWPDEETWADDAVFRLFEAIKTRVEMRFTEPEFIQFRSDLLENGLALREVERVPYSKPEPVYF